jgi:tight adherence protein C
MLTLIFLLVFGCVSLVAWLVFRPVTDDIGRRLGVSAPVPVSAPRENLIRRTVLGFSRRLGRTAARLLPQNFVTEIERKLVQANEPWPLVGFLGAWAASALFGLLLVLYISASAKDMTFARFFTLAVALLPTFSVLPYIVLRRKVINRQRAIVQGLPDALDLLVTCVEAGMAIDAAFAMVVEKTDGPLAETLSLYLKQAGMGLGRRSALVDVSERTGVPQLIGLASAVSQGEELGTPVADVLRRQAEDLRQDRRERAQSAAQRAPVLMTIPLVVCFMPAMAAVVIVPSILNLVRFTNSIGGG